MWEISTTPWSRAGKTNSFEGRGSETGGVWNSESNLGVFEVCARPARSGERSKMGGWNDLPWLHFGRCSWVLVIGRWEFRHAKGKKPLRSSKRTLRLSLMQLNFCSMQLENGIYKMAVDTLTWIVFLALDAIRQAILNGSIEWHIKDDPVIQRTFEHEDILNLTSSFWIKRDLFSRALGLSQSLNVLAIAGASWMLPVSVL